MQLLREHDLAPAASRQQALDWNAQGEGILLRTNQPGRVSAWSIELGGPKPDQRSRILRSPLVPSMIIETAAGYQACWVAKAAKPEHVDAVVAARLAPYFQASPLANLRAPGFVHAGFTANLAWKHNVGYTERQIAQVFPFRRVPRTTVQSSLPAVKPVLDAPLERAFVGALIASPDLHDQLPRELGFDTLGDFQAKSAFTAFANLRSQNRSITKQHVRDEIARRANHSDVEWFDRFVVDVKPQELVLGWARTIVRLAATRVVAAKVVDSTQEDLEAELDEFAMRDVE